MERVLTTETSQHAVPSPGLDRVQLMSACEAAGHRLREGILNGHLKPGQRLVEKKVAAELGIGQPTLREALKELEYQGFVRKVPKRGTYVTKLSHEDFKKILEVRMALESVAVEKAAENFGKQTVEEFEQIVTSMEEAAAEFDLARFHKSDLAFHRKLWGLTENEFLALALERVAFGLFAFVLLQRGPGATNEFMAAAQQHREIIDGLRSRDPNIAREAFVRSTLRFWNEWHRVGVQASPTVKS